MNNMRPNQESANKFLKCSTYVCIICIMIFCIFLMNIHGNISKKSFPIIAYTKIIREKKCTVIVHEPYGRLGNTLFEFASAYGLSLEHSCHLYVGPKMIKELSRYFKIDLPNLLTESDLNLTLSVRKLFNHCTYFPELFQPNTSQTIELRGYWQAQKHFVNQTNAIRRQLRFKETVLNPGKRFLETEIKNNTSNLVGIHVRRGDYIGQRRISSNEFIFDAMAYFTTKYGPSQFIFVSDDKSYCRNTFGKRNDTFFTPDSFTAAEDMAMITLCHHAIITVGTYGWWAGYLLHNRTGEVLTDSKPNRNPLDVNCEGSVFFPPWFQFLNRTK